MSNTKRGLNLDYLRTFAFVVELGSFSLAAERLRLSQPAVSLQVRQLERWFGMRLLDRIGRRVKPTAAGQELLGHASVTTTQIYTLVTVNALREVWAGAHPRAH